MEKNNFLRVQNINTKRRSYLAVDQNEFISDLLEHKFNENQLINNCLSGLIPEKARPLVWTILLNLIPLNKPSEWTFYFKKFSELHKNKIRKYLKIKNESSDEEYDYEAINRNLRLVNNENIQKSNFTNVNFSTNIKVSSLNSGNLNLVNNEEIVDNNKRENILENLESEENKKFNAYEKTEINLRVLNINSDRDLNKSKSPVRNEKRSFEILNKDESLKMHCDKYISDASRNNNPIAYKDEAPIFDLIPKNTKEEKFYLFYSQDPSQSIAKISSEDSEISEASNIIKLDVERTFQEIDLFKTTETKEILCKTLFIWYCENTDLGYKQGMNEILATIFYASFNINEPIFEKIPNSHDSKENKHTHFLNLIESEDFFQVTLHAIFDQILALGLKSIYNYHNLVEAKEFSYTEEKSNFEFIKGEIDEMLKDIDKNLILLNSNNYPNNVNNNQIANEGHNSNNTSNHLKEQDCNAILSKNDFEFVNKLNSNLDRKEKNKFFNLENISNFLLNKKERAKNNLNDSFKSLKDFILKRPWDFKRKKVNAQQQQKNKYKPDVEKNPPKKIDYKIFESENMDRLNLEQMLHLEQSDLRRRVNIVFFYYLKSYDPELYNHLLHKVDPYIIIFRWILCLFNREIGLKYVIYIWDCIFAIEFFEKNSTAFVKSFKNKPYRNVINNFNFVNFICVSIFEDMKNELLQEEEACFVLQMLMHFPNEKNVKEIVKRALKIRNFIYDKLHIKSDFVFND